LGIDQLPRNCHPDYGNIRRVGKQIGGEGVRDLESRLGGKDLGLGGKNRDNCTNERCWKKKNQVTGVGCRKTMARGDWL